MIKNKMSAAKKAENLISEEKVAYGHFEEIIRKYRVLIPYTSTQSEQLEKKIEKLLENREESENTTRKLKLHIHKALTKIESSKKKEESLDAKYRARIKDYNKMLDGKLAEPKSETVENTNLESLRAEREKYIENISLAFSKMEEEMQEILENKKEATDKKEKSQLKVKNLEEKLDIVNHKVSLYKDDIRNRLIKFNEHLEKERNLKKQYVALIKMMKKVPELTEDEEEAFKNGLNADKSEVKMLSLTSPVSLKPVKAG